MEYEVWKFFYSHSAAEIEACDGSQRKSMFSNVGQMEWSCL